MPGMWQTFQVCGDLGAAEPGLVDTLPHLGIVYYVNATNSTRKLLSSSSQPGSGSRAVSWLPQTHTVPGSATWVYLRASCQGVSGKDGFRTSSRNSEAECSPSPALCPDLRLGTGGCHRDWADRPLSLDMPVTRIHTRGGQTRWQHGLSPSHTHSSCSFFIPPTPALPHNPYQHRKPPPVHWNKAEMKPICCPHGGEDE